MSEAAKHSPTPWAVRPDPLDDWGVVRAADGLPVADAGVSARCREYLDAEPESFTQEQWEAGPPVVAANAALIVAAVNLHHRLVAACRKVIKGPHDAEAIADILPEIRALVAEAEGGS